MIWNSDIKCYIEQLGHTHKEKGTYRFSLFLLPFLISSPMTLIQYHYALHILEPSSITLLLEFTSAKYFCTFSFPCLRKIYLDFPSSLYFFHPGFQICVQVPVSQYIRVYKLLIINLEINTVHSFNFQRLGICTVLTLKRKFIDCYFDVGAILLLVINIYKMVFIYFIISIFLQSKLFQSLKQH